MVIVSTDQPLWLEAAFKLSGCPMALSPLEIFVRPPDSVSAVVTSVAGT